ncbi:MAG: response regulator [Anaeromyxobacteraceae bacterium]
MTERAQVLVVDDKESVLELMSSILSEAYDVTTVADPAAAISLIAERSFDVVLTDVRMPGATGFDVLAAVKRAASEAAVVMMTGFASVPDAVGAMRQGAFDYVSKPLEADDVSLVVARALEHRASRAKPAAAAAAAAATSPAAGPAVATDFREAVLAARDRASHDYLVALMRDFHGNVTRAATQAGMTREGLHRLLKKYGVRSDAFRAR